jgi:hypothetical protein
MKQTAVEWLVEQLIPEDQHEGIMDIIKEAKEMEKDQMKMFYYEADSYSCTCYKSPTDEDFEKYYNETYKQD